MSTLLKTVHLKDKAARITNTRIKMDHLIDEIITLKIVGIITILKTIGTTMVLKVAGIIDQLILTTITTEMKDHLQEIPLGQPI